MSKGHFLTFTLGVCASKSQAGVQAACFSWSVTAVVLGLLSAMILPQRAEAAKTRITRVDGCKAFISGGRFSTGDDVVFIGLRKGRRFPVLVRIEKEAERGRFEGTISDQKKCRFARGARHSAGATAEQEKDLFLVRSEWNLGYQNFSHMGLNMVLGDGEQNLPSLVLAKARVTGFPLVLSERGFFGQSVGFSGGIEASLPLLSDWEVDDGGAIQPGWLAWDAGLLLRPYLLGSEHPTEVSLAFTSASLSYEVRKSSAYQKSALRPLSCGSVQIGLSQVVGVTNDFSFFAGGAVQPASSCQTDAISEAESLEIERQQRAAGVPDERILSAAQIETNADLIDPFVYRVAGGFRYAFGDTFGALAQFHYGSVTGKLQHLDSQRAVALRTSGVLLGLDLTWGAD